MKRKRSTLAIVSTLVVMFALVLPAAAQEEGEGLPSPSASVSQLIGAGLPANFDVWGLMLGAHGMAQAMQRAVQYMRDNMPD